jgi:hypothetical protein
VEKEVRDDAFGLDTQGEAHGRTGRRDRGVEWSNDRGLRLRVSSDWLDLDEIADFRAP